MSNKIKIAINGFGRIGRVLTRSLINNKNNIEIVAVNDLVDTKMLCHLLKYDTVHGNLGHNINFSESSISINNQRIQVFNKKNPEDLPWKDLDIDIVIESTGFFRSKKNAAKHLSAGAKKVIISAPSTDSDVKTIVMGINDDTLTPNDTIVSNASCTTNCAAPMVKLVNDICVINEGFLTTTHAYTGDQNIHDAPHKDLRRSRAAAQNIIPTTTGAAKAIGRIFPDLEGKIEGIGIRVPVIDGSMTDLICRVDNPVSTDVIRDAFKNLSNDELKGVLSYTEDPIVSVDIIGNPNSCIIDGLLTTVVGNLVRVVGWYDNEVGYSNRLIDLVHKMG
jgi:glyceraldehyde 3-phosphate dehydrogenase